MKKLLDIFSFPVLIIISLFLGSAPIGAQPHLLEKINMLMAGQLTAPIDIFDLFMHSTPIVLLILKTIFYLKDKNNA
ncbi:hypothetical protein [sulfur-oxidizing endosymbiont of Gigantopelta aegis]|uniref:hypothetical protein n=1 Tax=sulfur-oxidizing endosymbiont of Gigantopelta aegis TaxID=2794934 RepID=UPI0018DCD919|nr:hypothetical protein [sulfur-oxidizing endosymbiont of Gigantopelta aegis]